MKKILAMLLTFIMLLSVAACSSDTQTDTSSATSVGDGSAAVSAGESSVAQTESAGSGDETSGEVSGEVSNEGSDSGTQDDPDDGFVMNEDVAVIKGLVGKAVDRSLPAKNYFLDRKYTYSIKPDYKHKDPNGEMLTNGDSMDVVYGEKAYVGWSNGTSLIISFDLGEATHSIGDIAVGCARVLRYSIDLPKYVSVEASKDGKEYTQVGKIVTPTDLADTCKYVYNFAFPKAITARYVRIVFVGSGKRLLIDEIEGYEYRVSGNLDIGLGQEVDQRYPITDFYKYNLNLGESSVQCSASDADYNTRQNLARLAGVDFQIQHFDNLPPSHSNSRKDKVSLLTDGVRHSSDIEGQYFVFYRGTGRHVVVDLGHIMAVDGCTVTFQDRLSWGIATPPVYYISLSENGTDWTTVYAKHNPDYGVTSKFEDTHEISFDDAYRARYVRITFATVPDNDISSSVYMGEFEVWGKKNPKGAIKAVEQDDNPYGKYPDPEEYGVSDILWAGIGNEVGEVCTTNHVITVDTAYHYLTTTDENDQPLEVYYDSIAFTTRGNLSWEKDRNKSYEWFLKELFRDGVNMDALEEAMTKINQKTGGNRKVTVWIPVNCPVIGDTWNGKTIKTAQDYIDCLKWMVDSALEAYEAKDYKYVTLVGFYWQVENLRPNYYSPAEAYDIPAAIAFNEYVHSFDLMTVWLPYYSHLNGIWHSHYYGFDITCWQPGTMFSPTETTRMSTIAELARLYGVGIEIEIEPLPQGKESMYLYREYLGAGYDYGFMNSINAYYQGPVPGAHVLYKDSTDPYCKEMYDETVLYVQGKLDRNYNERQPADLSGFTDMEMTVSEGKIASIQIGDLSDLEVQFSQISLYGTLQLNADGTLSYTAMKDFRGEEEIKIDIYDGVSQVKTITIRITVTK